VTYNCTAQIKTPAWQPMTLREARSLVAGTRQTGHRTWAGALHLAAYLLSSSSSSSSTTQSSDGSSSSLVAGRSVLELGAGTGFLSVLCARHLGARFVAATDGDPAVVRGLRENVLRNGLGEGGGGGGGGDDETNDASGGGKGPVVARTLLWGPDLQDQAEAREVWEEKRDGEGASPRRRHFDLVLGADIVRIASLLCSLFFSLYLMIALTWLPLATTQIYEKTATEALVEALRCLLDMYPQPRILLSNALRFPDVFETFRRGCGT
jgi:protein-lysine N-methyltransferase EEF2KMT